MKVNPEIYLISKKLDENIIFLIQKNFALKNINIVTTGEELKKTYQKKWLNIRFIDENEILNKNKIAKKLEPIGNVGWYYQQLLKYETVLTAGEEYIHIIDGDSIIRQEWSKPDILATTGKSSYKNYTYFSKLAIGFCIKEYSFVTNQMVFNKSILQEMIDHIKTMHNNGQWVDIFIKIMKENNNAIFSEYQLYGDYIYKIKKVKPEIIKVFRRMDCINDTPESALSKYGLIAYEPQHKTGFHRFIRANILYKFGLSLG